jgi:preprotein translocase subunit SecE
VDLTILCKSSSLLEALRGAFLKTKLSIQYFMSKIVEYFKDTKTELKHVIWPSKAQTFAFTVIVIVLSVLIGYFLGIFDFIFSKGLERIISF